MLSNIRAFCRLNTETRLQLNIRQFIRNKTTENDPTKGKNNTIQFKIGGKEEVFEVVNVQTEANKFYNKFHTLRGQKIVGGLWIFSSMMAVVYQMGPHTFFKSWVQNIYQAYDKGFPNPVRKGIKALVNNVLSDMELDEDPMSNLKLFVLTLDEARSWGEPGSALVGYPAYFDWDDVEDVPLPTMRFGGGWKPGNVLSLGQLESKEAQLFRESMILSEEAKKFAFAREISWTQHSPQYNLAILNSCWILLTYNVARILNKQLDMFRNKPPILRGVLYMGIMPTAVCSYFLIRDLQCRLTEKKSVREAVALGPQYAKGGEEYYNKLLLRNKCLRVLDPEHSKFTMDGELYQGIIRTKRVPLLELRDICTESKNLT